MADSTRRRAVVRGLGDGDLGLWVGFHAKDQAKAIPGARWDPGLKCWRVHRGIAREAEALVDRLNATITNDTTTNNIISTSNLVTEMFMVLPPHLREPTYRALARAWHPDRGGDTGIMQALTSSWAGVRR